MNFVLQRINNNAESTIGIEPPEEWRPIKDHEWYEVSNLGRVRSIARVISHSHGAGKRRLSGSILTILDNSRGYKFVWLQNRGAAAFYIHRLVAHAFLPTNDPTKTEVNHINSDRSDNRVCNLEWVTRKENVAHTVRAARHTRGESQPGSKLKNTDVVCIRQMAGQMSQAKIAKKFGVSPALVNRIIKWKSWNHVQ